MNKIKLIWNELYKINDNIEYFIITNMSNIKYITGEEIEGYILLERNMTYIVTDGRYVEVANNVCNNIENTRVINILDKDVIYKLLQNKIVGIEAKDIDKRGNRQIQDAASNGDDNFRPRSCLEKFFDGAGEPLGALDFLLPLQGVCQDAVSPLAQNLRKLFEIVRVRLHRIGIRVQNGNVFPLIFRPQGVIGEGRVFIDAKDIFLKLV